MVILQKECRVKKKLSTSICGFSGITHSFVMWRCSSLMARQAMHLTGIFTWWVELSAMRSKKARKRNGVEILFWRPKTWKCQRCWCCSIYSLLSGYIVLDLVPFPTIHGDEEDVQEDDNGNDETNNEVSTSSVVSTSSADHDDFVPNKPH